MPVCIAVRWLRRLYLHKVQYIPLNLCESIGAYEFSPFCNTSRKGYRSRMRTPRGNARVPAWRAKFYFTPFRHLR